MSQSVVHADFLGAARSAAQLPQHELPEIAFVGRSNVGKSSLINRITGRRKLARTSNTPGRTQEINCFELALKGNEQRLVLADLPGFGYAKVSKQQREGMSRMIVDYLRERTQLRIVCLLNDSRRTPQEDEMAVRNILFESPAHLIVALTKADKLKRNDRTKVCKQISAAYGLESQDVVLTGENEPIAALWERIFLLL